MEPPQPPALLGRMPPHHSAPVTHRPCQYRLTLPRGKHCDRPGAEAPYLAKVVEEVKGVDVGLVGEVHDAVQAVVLDMVERRVPAARAAVHGHGEVLPPAAGLLGRLGGGGGQVAIHDPAAAEQSGRLARGGAILDDEPEQRGRREAERVREPAQVVGLERAGAGRRHDQEQLRL